MLEIADLHAEIDGKAILTGLDLTVNTGEVHAIMGPNGAGKSAPGYACHLPVPARIYGARSLH